MAAKRSHIQVFDYFDYREFLRDWYADKKATTRSFSYRAFSQRAGFSSPNFLKLVMDGDRNLTARSIVKFMKGLRLNKQEQAYFQHLVDFTQAETHAERDASYQKLLKSRKLSQLKPLHREQYEYYADWYHPVIRELVMAPGFDGTPEWLAARLVPAISPAQAARSLSLLETLGMIEQTACGSWKQVSTIVTTGPEVRSVMLMNYHRLLLELSKDSLDRVAAKDRDVSALTLGIAAEKLPVLKKKIQQFRKDILEFVADDVAPEVVVQLNMQLLPVSELSEGAGDDE